MIPSFWVELHRKELGKYDWTLPRDQWTGEQGRDFAEFLIVASDQGIIDGGSELTYVRNFDKAVELTINLGIKEVEYALARAGIVKQAIPVATPPAAEPPKPKKRFVFGRFFW